MERKLTYVLYATPNGFTARCLDVDVSVEARSDEEAVVRLSEALASYFTAHPDEIALPSQTFRLGQLLVTP
jgi:hypothetical protein